MNGILNILKPPGMTSFDVVAYIRGLSKTKRTGHTGTLDPMAAGVLTVCLGNATGAIEFLVDKDKLYRAELTLGASTDTQDSSGTVLYEKPVVCGNAEIEAAMASFVGPYDQLPPMYSALKVNGRKLYELAREGVSVERTPRRVEIYSAKVIRIDRGDGDKGKGTGLRQDAGSSKGAGKISPDKAERAVNGGPHISYMQPTFQPAPTKYDGILTSPVRILFDIHCSRGTYIRTLCADIGERLGCGGHMSFLLRKRAGAFGLEDSATLEEIRNLTENGKLHTALTDVEAAFPELDGVKLDASQEKKFVNGLRFSAGETRRKGLVKVYGAEGRFLALGEIYENSGESLLKSRKFFNP